jgi:threonine aldolase
MPSVQTNIVIFRLPAHLPDAETVVRCAKEQGVLVLAFAPRTVRVTTHLNVSAAHRSDTVTKPSDAMRAAMANAQVGDDQYGEDPSVNLLQERIAALLGKEAALFVPSGTMANQIGLRLLARPGDEVIVGAESHIVWHEAGASSANAGVQFQVAGQGGTFDEAAFRSAYKPKGHFVFPPSPAKETPLDN